MELIDEPTRYVHTLHVIRGRNHVEHEWSSKGRQAYIRRYEHMIGSISNLTR